MTWFRSGLWLLCVWLVFVLVHSTSVTNEGSAPSGRIDPKNVNIRSFRKHVMTEGQFKKIDESNDPEKELENWWNSQTQLNGVPLPYTNTIVVVKSMDDMKAALVKSTKLNKQDDADSLFETHATFPQFDITKAKDGTFTLMNTGNRHVGFAAEDKDGKRSVFHYQAFYYGGKAGKRGGVQRYPNKQVIPVSGYEMKIPKETVPHKFKKSQPASNKGKSKPSAIRNTPGSKSSDQETKQQDVSKVDLNDNDDFPSLSGKTKPKKQKQKQSPKQAIVSEPEATATEPKSQVSSSKPDTTGREIKSQISTMSASDSDKETSVISNPSSQTQSSKKGKAQTSPDYSNHGQAPPKSEPKSKPTGTDYSAHAQQLPKARPPSPKSARDYSRLTSGSDGNRGSPGSNNLGSTSWATKNKNLQNVPQLGTNLRPGSSNKHSPPPIDNNNNEQIVNEQDSRAKAGETKPKPSGKVKNSNSHNVPETNTNLNAGSSNKQSSVALDNNNNAQVEPKKDTSSNPGSPRKGSITSNQQPNPSGTTKRKPPTQNSNKGNRRNHA